MTPKPGVVSPARGTSPEGDVDAERNASLRASGVEGETDVRGETELVRAPAPPCPTLWNALALAGAGLGAHTSLGLGGTGGVTSTSS